MLMNNAADVTLGPGSLFRNWWTMQSQLYWGEGEDLSREDPWRYMRIVPCGPKNALSCLGKIDMNYREPLSGREGGCLDLTMPVPRQETQFEIS